MTTFQFVLHWASTKLKSSPKIHHEIRFRNFNNFDFNAFIADNDFKSFENMLGISDPDSALQLWVQIFTSIFNKHAPHCTKRVKTRKHNHWFTSEIKLGLKHRDWLLKHGSHVEYKKQRNNVKNLIRKTKKTYFETIIKIKFPQKVSGLRLMRSLEKRSMSKLFLLFH